MYLRVLLFVALCGLPAIGWAQQNPLALPTVGATSLQILTPGLLELSVVTRKAPDPAPVPELNFIDSQSHFNPPNLSNIVVKVGGTNVPVRAIGFRRRPLYAPLNRRDLRLGNYLYLELAAPIGQGDRVEVTNLGGQLWPKEQHFVATADPMRLSPAIHVNQEGYLPDYPKKAMVGYYLGSLGEMSLAEQSPFNLVDARSGEVFFSGKLKLRQDRGFEFTPRPYQQVFEADFSAFKKPGQYRLQVPGLGVSFPFAIDEGIAADFARAYALGLYHQRCGTANELPFTRFTHDPCHLAKAEVPTDAFKAVNEELAGMTGDFASNPRHKARQLKSVSASLYPFVTTNKIDVSGGHHDAGDYSKYTINSAHLIHVLTFAADAFPGVGDLDNLGIPESGDHKSDVLQEAKWEADFLAKMQDVDGGFYFLVYPRDREYEDNVSLIAPNCGDPQVVFPKTTAATAAAVAALAQLGSSPRFKAQFPEAAAMYLEKAKKGWAFLQRAIAKYGRDGSYQKITHYGDEFMHDDELVWAATELFVATGDRAYEKEVIDHFDPANPETRRWTWWRLFESYGNAVRSYAFAVRTGRLTTNQVDQRFLAKCEDEIIAAAQDQVQAAAESAYGTSFPNPSKRFRNAGWYFSLDRAFDLAVAYQINYPILNDPRPRFVEALLGNLNYDGGCNPVNMNYLTGVGWKRQHEIVHHYAQNQKRSLPPTGLDIGNIQEGFAFLDPYQKELGALTFPPDWDKENPYPFYDRWGDSFNTSTEFVTVNLGRALGACLFLMAQTPLKSQSWRAVPAQIEQTNADGGKVSARLKAPGMDLSLARCVWEAEGENPVLLPGDQAFSFKKGAGWVEAEAWWPDGRRVFGRNSSKNSPHK